MRDPVYTDGVQVERRAEALQILAGQAAISIGFGPARRGIGIHGIGRKGVARKEHKIGAVGGDPDESQFEKFTGKGVFKDGKIRSGTVFDWKGKGQNNGAVFT